MTKISTGLLMLMYLTATPAFAQSIAVIVNPKSPGVSQEAISNVFLGKSVEFVAVDLPDSSPIRDAFYQKVTGKDGAQLKAYWAKLVFTGKAQPLKELPSDAEVKKFVAANPNAIGYIDKGSVDGSVKVVLTP